jgi:signal transduction histidine kinase
MCQLETAVNHEVRTALNAIMGFAQILNLRNNTKEEIKSYAGIICQQSQNLLEIFNEMQKTISNGREEAVLSAIQTGIHK